MTQSSVKRDLLRASFALVIAATIGGASLASGQEQQHLEPGGRSVSATKQLLHERNRAVLHMGQSIELSGLNASDARARTPALARGESAVTKVETPNYYERTLAMYEDRKLLELPPELAPESKASRRVKPVTAPPKALPPPVPSAGRWVWITGLLTIPLLALLLVQLRGGLPWKRAVEQPRRAGSPSRARVPARAT